MKNNVAFRLTEIRDRSSRKNYFHVHVISGKEVCRPYDLNLFKVA